MTDTDYVATIPVLASALAAERRLIEGLHMEIDVLRQQLRDATAAARRERERADDRYVECALQHYAATHDDLTGLANRNWLLREAPVSAGLIVIDLDGFKTINDTLGHAAGDELLRQVARILTDVLDDDLAVRLGGDEFAILTIPNLNGPGSVANLALRAIAARAGIHSSAGWTHVIPGEGMPATMRRADLALYHAKHRGRHRAVGWMEGMEMPAPRTYARRVVRDACPTPSHRAGAGRHWRTWLRRTATPGEDL